MIAVRYHQRNGVVQVRRLHGTLTLAHVQRVVDDAIDQGALVRLWGADEEIVEFDPRDCNDVQLLDLQRG